MSLLSNMDWANWLWGMWVAYVNGISTAALASIALYLQDPSDFNPRQPRFWTTAGMIVAMTGAQNFFLYLKQHPAPTPKVKIVEG